MRSSLGRNFSAFESQLVTTTGRRFRGIIYPASDSVSTTQLVETRLLLRTRPNEPVYPGDLINDPAGRPFLVGRDDTQILLGGAISKTFRLYRCTGSYSWKRPSTFTDPVTNLQQRTGETELGPIWCAVEILSNLDIDRGTHQAAEKHHVITGSPIQLQDKIDTWIVRRVTQVFGIYVAETE